jgi:hypothetical protein
MKPNTPKTRGIGTSVLTPNTQRGTVPTANKAAAQVKPIPIAPRMRRSHFRMSASGPGLAPRTFSASAFSRAAKFFVLQSINQGGEIQER